MQKMSRYGVAAIQNAMPSAFAKDQVKANLERAIELTRLAKMGCDLYGHPVKLVVFPETFLHGFPFQSNQDYIDNGIYASIPDGPEIRAFIQLAKEFDMYIQTGSMFEYDPKYPGHVFNTACIVGPEGLVLKYRKINPWIPAEGGTSPLQIKDYSEPLFPVADTPIGKLGVLICYDLMFPENARQIVFNGAEVLITPGAYMHPFTGSGPMNWWRIVSQCRSIENIVYGVHCNQGASLKEIPPFSFPGGTCIVDYEGRVLSEISESGEHIVYSHIDLDGLRAWRAKSYQHMMLGHLRTEAYNYLQKPIFPCNTHGPNESLTFSQNMKMTEVGRKVYLKES
ncbi:MAG: nitrilase [Firmicutes bacterium]|nr:nitrilase [Bacillota bacterium]